MPPSDDTHESYPIRKHFNQLGQDKGDDGAASKLPQEGRETQYVAAQVLVIQNLPEERFRFFEDRNSGLEIFGLDDVGDSRLQVDRLFEEEEVTLVAKDPGRPDDVIARKDDAAGVLKQHRGQLNCEQKGSRV